MWVWLLVLAAMADFLATVLAIEKWGLISETNRAAAAIYAMGGWVALGVAKAAGTYIIYQFGKRTRMGRIAAGIAIGLWGFGALMGVLVLI